MPDIIKHPWGSEVIWANTTKYSAKMYVILEGYKTQYIYHKSQDKTIFVLSGTAQLVIESINKLAVAGSQHHIPPKIMHRIMALKGDVTILEAGTEFVDDIVIVEG